MANYLQGKYDISIRHSCGLLDLSRSTYNYNPVCKDDTVLKIRLRDLAFSRRRYGYRRLTVLLQREGWKVNHKRVYRIYSEEGLSVRTKKRRKRVSHNRIVIQEASIPNEVWSMDFISDTLYNGMRFRIFTVIDNYTRECPLMVVDFSLTGKKVVKNLDFIVNITGVPKVIRVDNGSEFF